MKRFYYISENLAELSEIERELEAKGISRPQIHVLSERDADVEQHHLHEVEAVMKKDVVRSMQVGALIGAVGSIIILAVAYLSGVTAVAGWIPFVFLAVVVLGFCTWEGGFFGIQEPNEQFKQFRRALQNGYHIFFVDTATNQEEVLEQVMRTYPHLQVAGMGKGMPSWVVCAQNSWKKFIHSMP